MTPPTAGIVGGQHPDTAMLRNALARRGVRAPHSGEPYSEAMLLGLGGGVGGGYFVFEFGGIPTFFAGFRHSWEYPHKFLAATCERLGAAATFQETGGARAAEAQLDRALEEGRYVI